MWMSAIGDMHDCFCGCKTPFAHLLDNIFPIGHTDRNKSINYIVNRDYQQCLSGGEDEESHGIPLGGTAASVGAGEGHIKEEEEGIDALFAAAVDAAEDIR